LIYIDASTLNVPKEWKEEAEHLAEQLRSIPPAERARFINQHSYIWRRLKRELERISHNKCWYCEAKNTRSNSQVDHHRPKNKIKNEHETDEPGYWWLAFDHRNFRLACNYCNCPHKGKDGIIRGKSNQFPLLPASTRATNPNSNTDDEEPLLLDPTNPLDPPLLWFVDDGKACPRELDEASSLNLRAKETIEILNLNDCKIMEARRDLWVRCINLIDRADTAFVKYKSSSPTGRKEFEIVIREILRLVDPSSEFSATARAFFRGSAREWVKEIIQLA
jgi:uncharacterized protein (TIGR02646 family)